MKQRFSPFLQKAGLAWMALNYAPALFAEVKWFPTVAAEYDMSKEGSSPMKSLGAVLKDGFMILLFAVCMITFFKFISTVSHGIEEAKKNEGGSMAVFVNFTFLAIVYFVMSIASGYAAYAVLTKFNV